MAEQPTVTTPGGSDLFASLGPLDYSSFSDDAMAMLVDENLSSASASSTTTATSTGRTPTYRTGLTPGSATRNPNEPLVMTPRTVAFMADLAATSTPTNQPLAPNQTAMLFDHDAVTSGLETPVVKEEDENDDDDDGDLRTDDLPTPLSFSYATNGPASVGSAASGNARYHVAAAHKHKRVRSNPDMLQNVNFQQLLGNVATSPMRPSVSETQAMDMSTDDASYEPLPAPLPISIGTVNVVTPVGFHVGETEDSNNGGDADMASFLKDMQWSDLAENNSMNVDTLSDLGAGYRSQRIQAGMNELKMKRKRPTQHMRHHSNPVELLHNLDQFRLLSQQQQVQQQQVQPPPPVQQQYTPPPSPPLPMQYASPTKLGGMMAMQQAPMMAPNAFAMQQPMPTMQDNLQFQVPTDIANGTARSLHARRSSMPSSRGRAGGHRRAASRGSTGLSMDMSQLNLEFLTLPEAEFQQQLEQQRQQQVFQHAMGGVYASPPSSPPLPTFQQQLNNAGMTVGELEAEKNRKSYKCGRCGKPKVGHVCTMPDLRNNWTQVDVEVTKGLKIVRSNCHIVATKNKWVPQHEDNL